MRFGYRLSAALFILLLIPGWCLAQTPEVTVGNIDFPEKKWGNQKLEFEVTSNVDWLIFLMVETEASFADGYAAGSRSSFSNYILEPHETKTIDPIVSVPGSFGKAEVWVRIHAVVDTLDDISLGTLVHEQPIYMTFHATDEIQPYLQERLSVPPLMDASEFLDNEVDRLILLLLSEGKDETDILKITGSDPLFVQSEISRLMAGKYVVRRDTKYIPGIPIIALAEAEKGKEIADRLAESMAEKIVANLARLKPLEDSLFNAGFLDQKSKSFVGGAALLDHPYPLVTGLLLWERLGSRFINGSAPLEIYKQTDPCRPYIGQYCYLVQGGDYYNGQQFFDGQFRRASATFTFGDTVPAYTCKPGWRRKPRLREGADYELDRDFRPQSYHYTSEIMEPFLVALEAGLEEDMKQAAEDLMAAHEELGQGAFTAGVKYWFWNLAASRATRLLLELGALTREGNGQYKFSGRLQ